MGLKLLSIKFVIVSCAGFTWLLQAMVCMGFYVVRGEVPDDGKSYLKTGQPLVFDYNESELALGLDVHVYSVVSLPVGRTDTKNPKILKKFCMLDYLDYLAIELGAQVSLRFNIGGSKGMRYKSLGGCSHRACS